MIKKIVVFIITNLFIMINLTALPCFGVPATEPKLNEIIESNQDELNSITKSSMGEPPLPPVIWTEDFSTFYISIPQNPDGDDVRYHIDWGDGNSEWTVYYAPGETACIHHEWIDEGTYEIKVKAEDPDGESKWVVYILSLSSDFKFFGVKIGYIDMIYTFTIYWNNGCDCFIIIDWDDGETTDWIGPYEQPLLFTHSWDLIGEYEIKLKMKDVWGNESDWLIFTITILNFENNAPNKPNITGKWIVVFVVLECNFVTIDPDGDDVRYHIDWSDGNPEVTDFYKSDETVTIRHTFSEQSTYVITAYAEDIHGAIGQESNFIPRNKNKAVNLNLFMQFLEQFPLLKNFLSFI